jgi:ketopantoate reductase
MYVTIAADAEKIRGAKRGHINGKLLRIAIVHGVATPKTTPFMTFARSK